MTTTGVNLIKSPSVLSSWTDFTKNDMESYNLLKSGIEIPKLNGAVSFGIGADVSLQYSDRDANVLTVPLVELGYKQKFPEVCGLKPNVDVRYRNIGGTNQLRTTAGLTKSINNRASVFTKLGYTTVFEDGKDKINIFVGGDYKLSENISIGADIQQNIKLDDMSMSPLIFGAGVTCKF